MVVKLVTFAEERQITMVKIVQVRGNSTNGWEVYNRGEFCMGIEFNKCQSYGGNKG
jgi:hypothetical protein